MAHDPQMTAIKGAVWAAIRQTPSIHVTPGWGPWVTDFYGKVMVTGLSHLPAVSAALTKAGVGHTTTEGSIEVDG